MQGASPTASGLLLLPLMARAWSSPRSLPASSISRTGRYKIFPIVGAALMTVGLLLLSRLSAGTTGSASLSMVRARCSGWASAVCRSPCSPCRTRSTYKDLGAATSATFFRPLGGSFGTAVFGAILLNRLQHNLAVLLPSGTGGPAPVDLGSLQGAPQQLRALPGPVLHALLEAFARSYQVVYRWAIPFAVATLLFALLLREAPLRTTTHVDRDQEEEATP